MGDPAFVVYGSGLDQKKHRLPLGIVDGNQRSKAVLHRLRFRFPGARFDRTQCDSYGDAELHVIRTTIQEVRAGEFGPIGEEAADRVSDLAHYLRRFPEGQKPSGDDEEMVTRKWIAEQCGIAESTLRKQEWRDRLGDPDVPHMGREPDQWTKSKATEFLMRYGRTGQHDR